MDGWLPRDQALGSQGSGCQGPSHHPRQEQAAGGTRAAPVPCFKHLLGDGGLLRQKNIKKKKPKQTQKTPHQLSCKLLL